MGDMTPATAEFALTHAAEEISQLRRERDAATAANADLTDRLDRTLNELREVAAQRDRLISEAGEQLQVKEALSSLLRQAVIDRDAADAALADVSDLLDGLRTKVTRLVAIAEGTADAFALERGLAAETGERVARSMAVGLRGVLAREHATPQEVQP